MAIRLRRVLKSGPGSIPPRWCGLQTPSPVHLGHVVKADTRWRLFAFCPDEDPSSADSAIAGLCRFLAEDPRSPVRSFTRPDEAIDAVIDLRAIFQQGTRDLALETLPAFLKPQKGSLGLVDYEKMFCPDLKIGPDIFDARGHRPETGMPGDRAP